MKTNNIFRTLFMAVLLLMGVSNVKADNVVLYDNPNGSGNYAYMTLPYGTFDGYEGETLRITYAIIPPNTPCQIKIGNVKTVPVTESGIYEMTLDQDFYTNINTTDPYNASIFIQPENVSIYKIEIVSAGGSDGEDNGNTGGEESTSYTISIGEIANGTVTADPMEAEAGTTITLTAEPAEGYEFVSWTVTDANGNEITVTDNQFTMPESDVTISAEFKEVENSESTTYYTITIGEIANGTVTADAETAEAGTIVTLTAEPAEGYEFVSWTVTDANDNEITVTDNQFTMPESDVTISAEFKEVENSEPTTYTITIGEIANGTVTADAETAEAGAIITLTAVPADGYEFVSWTVKDANGNEITVTDNQFEMPESDVTVSATFEEEQTSTQPTEGTVIWEGSEGNCENGNIKGSIKIEKDFFSGVTPGSKIRVYFSCYNQYSWQYILKSDNQVGSNLWSNWNGYDWGGQMLGQHNDYIDDYFEFEVSANGAACLARSGLDITDIMGINITCVTLVLGDAPSGPITYDVNIYQYISNGSVTANPTRAEAGETVTLTITPDTNYELEWLSVKDGNDQDVSVDWSNYTFTMPASSVTVYAGFKWVTTEPTYYNVSISTTGNGSVSANPSSATEGTTVTLYVSPYDGYELDGLSVKDGNNNDVSVNWSNYTFTMPASNVTVYATFKEKAPVYSEYIEATVSSSTGYATFCSDKALDFSTVSGLKAYYAQSISGGYVALVQVTGTVAAGTGLVLVGSSASIPVVSSGSEISSNLLKGVLYNSETINSANCYVLTVENGQVKFASTVSHSAEIPAGHAYLRSSSSYSRLAVKISGETTGIEDMVLPDSQEEEVYYDLRGMRVAQPTRGIYIVNGKKVFVK